MLDGSSNFGWKRVENLVNCQQLLFTRIEWHSKFGSSLCKNRWEKHHRAFIKVVEGPKIYNFAYYTSEHFSCKIWSKTRSNMGKPKRWSRSSLRPPSAGVAEHRGRLPSAASNPRNGTLGEPTPFPCPFPAEPSLPLAGIELPSLAKAPGTQLQLEFASWGPIYEIWGPVRKSVSSRSRVKMLNLVKCIENCRKFRKMQTQFCWTPCEKH
jgi:hypothetical protein